MAWDDDIQGDWRNPTSLSSDNDSEDVDESYEDELAIDPLDTLDKSKDDNIVINIGSVPRRRTLDCVSNNQPPPGARNKKFSYGIDIGTITEMKNQFPFFVNISMIQHTNIA